MTGGILESRFKREVGRSAGNARRTAGSALHIPLPDGRLRQDRATLAAGRGRASLVSPRGTTMARSRLSPTSAHDRTVEPLASPGWALTAASCILMLCCRAAVGFSELPSALRTQRWSTVVSRAGAWTSSLFSTPCRRTCLDTTDYAASPGGVI